MLALTDHQLDYLKRTVSLLPPHDRDAFLRSVAGRLTTYPPTDDDLVGALCFVLRGRGVAIGSAAFQMADDHRGGKDARR
jgi:hypothetical protein